VGNARSPEQIARRLPVDFPDDETMRISHEVIYQALFRGAPRLRTDGLLAHRYRLSNAIDRQQREGANLSSAIALRFYKNAT
jgi:hypothetical protein